MLWGKIKKLCYKDLCLSLTPMNWDILSLPIWIGQFIDWEIVPQPYI